MEQLGRDQKIPFFGYSGIGKYLGYKLDITKFSFKQPFKKIIASLYAMQSITIFIKVDVFKVIKT